MKKYIVAQTSDTPDWKNIEVIKIGESYLETPDNISAYAQICYNKNEILVHLSSFENGVRAEESGPFGMPCLDSCLEFFFCPEENDLRYFNIEFNSNGCVFLGFGSGDADLLRLIPEESIESIFSPKIDRREDGWDIFYRVPYSYVYRIYKDFKVYPGKQMRANFYKCQEGTTPRHFLSWSRVDSEKFTFHVPSCFGLLEFQ